MNFEFRRRPTIRKVDLAEVVALLEIFDRVSFNYDGDFIAELDCEFPILGKLIVSYYAQQHHVQVRRGDDAIYNHEHHVTNRLELLAWVKAELLKQLAI